MVLTVASVAFFLTTNWKEKVLPKRFELSGTDADLRLKDIFLVEDKKGQKAWELKAKWAKMYREAGKTLFEDIHVIVFLRDRRPIHITALRGEMDNSTRDLIAEGNVEVVSEEGYSLRTERLTWFAGKREIVTDAAVRAAGQNLRVSGRGLKALVDKELLWLDHQVVAQLIPKR
jgi:LPS export ABC transporter protein LptC